ncbi:hypothetical protein C4577_07610 [Candidatus Parcubacteria bacterium]|nr:MAG: hypothetical protein C4577_07610 [Candidatus Parcubacteria bacterium]
MNPKSFSYFDGSEMRRAPDSDALKKDLIDKIREVFAVKKFEDGGLTQTETLELLYRFLIITSN